MGRTPLFLLLALLGACAVTSSFAGERFKDCPDCPEMIALPGGAVLMGSPQDEALRDDDRNNHDEDDLEGPGGQQVRVTVRPFAMGAYEVTRAQYRAFLNATGRTGRGGCISILKGQYRSHPEGRWDNTGGPNGDSLPVTCVDWYEARTYAAWLSAKTGRHYRLPSEAEFEYALRAGTTTRFFWGDDQEQVCRFGNVPDATFAAVAPGSPPTFSCKDGYILESPVGSFAPNPFGLYDMTGNMFEWLADCYQRSYAGLPLYGYPFERPNCEARSARGGSVGYRFLSAFRSADRSDDRPEEAWYGVGFRLAREP